MRPSIFLSHNHRDKEFVRRLGRDLALDGIKVWIDEAEILVGDSLLQKVESAIEDMEYLGVVLSKNSINSEWVKREVRLALTNEIYNKKVTVLPILLDDVEIFSFLKDKLYVDFRDMSNYDTALMNLIRSIRRNYPRSSAFFEYILEKYKEQLALRGLVNGKINENGLCFILNDRLRVELKQGIVSFNFMKPPFFDQLKMGEIIYDRRRLTFKLRIDLNRFELEYLDEHWESDEYLNVMQYEDKECKTFGWSGYIHDFKWEENKLTLTCYEDLFEQLILRKKYKENYKEITKNEVHVSNGIFDCSDFILQFVKSDSTNNSFLELLLNEVL